MGWENMIDDKTATSPKALKRISWLFFLALMALYVALMPGTIEGQGYNQENLAAANQIVTNCVNVATGQPMIRVEWTRHGFIEPIFQLPFAFASRALFHGQVKWTGRLASFQPMLATSWLCTLLLLWTVRLTRSLRWGVLLAVCAGLGTMLWPYVYIGLETTQSLALMLAAYLVLGREPTRTWPETWWFAIACAVAVAVKLNGIFLAPAIGFLILKYVSRSLRPSLKLIGVLSVIATIYGLNWLAKARYWSGMDGGTNYYEALLVDSPLTAALQAFAYFGSPNKSLLLFCPILALSFATMGRAWRRQPQIVIFAWLLLGGLISGFSITVMWADETWGPRYLHAAVAPLLLCLAATKAARVFQWKREALTLALLVLGMAISLLGSLFSYGALHLAATQSSQATLEALQYDPAWNHLRFNWQLFRIWVRSDSDNSNQSAWWPPPRHWWFAKPEGTPPENPIDLKSVAQPQPLWVQSWRPTMSVSPRTFLLLRGMCCLCLVLGLGGMVWIWRQAAAADRYLKTTESLL